MVNFKTVLYYAGIVVLSLVIILILLIYKTGKELQLKRSQKNSIKTTDSSMTKTWIGPVKNYQIIPAQKNPNGGWDSITGWYEPANKEQYWKETWMNQ